MESKQCPDCDAGLDRRDFLKTVSAAAAAAVSIPQWATPKVQAAPSRSSAAETAVKALYETLTDDQKKVVCFDWDFKDEKRGLLRTFVSNNWMITEPAIRSDFYTKKQQIIIHDIFKGVINPDWHARFLKQLKDDTRGQEWGAEQTIAIFGKPGEKDQFEFVMTGRHMTVRADGNSENRYAFGGPIFYGHAASGFNEKIGHPNNVFWHQARMANFVFQMMDGKQREKALVDGKRPKEYEVGFQGAKGKFPGIAVSDLSADQKKELERVLAVLVEPYRKEDQERVTDCLKKQGGLEKCSLAFYKDGDLGDDGEWDNWRLEGPSFVWYFRGEPHVHVWVNVASVATIPLNARG
ncbi:MAG: DUF3500 domain-containing protein [Gemmataceae bacterium]|nr:DUF3500 domain-containing protein [Gemmataceae bacterium]